MVVVHLIREGIRAGLRIYATGPKFWGARGYKQGYRQSIDHIVWIGGATAETLKGYAPASPGNEASSGYETGNSQYKTRVRFKSDPCRSYSTKYARKRCRANS